MGLKVVTNSQCMDGKRTKCGNTVSIGMNVILSLERLSM